MIRGYRAVLDPEAVGLPLTALIAVTPSTRPRPDDVPQRLEHIPEIESCFSVAGEESYVLLVRVGQPGDLEDLLAPDPQRRQRPHPHHRRAVHPWEGRHGHAEADDHVEG